MSMRRTARPRSARASAGHSGVRAAFALLAGLALVAGCGPPPPPVATPSLGMDRTSAPLGAPLEVTIRFDAAPDLAPPAEDYRVLLHFLDHEGEMLWADDHDPPLPTSAWQPGARIEYTRRARVPVYPYLGEATVVLGLYAPESGERLPLAGAEFGERTYRVAGLLLLPQPETAFVTYGDGWHRTETGGGRNWRWTTAEAVLSFRNPRADALLTMELDGRPDVGDGRQHVALAIGERTVHEFDVQSSEPLVVRSTLDADDLGDGDIVELALRVDPPFVPAERNAASTDRRELGVRVFYLFIEPQ